MTDAPTLPEAWKPIDVSSSDEQERALGPLELRIQRASGEWSVARSYAGPHTTGGVDTAAQDVRVRFVASSSASDVITLSPALAPRAIVARPEDPVWVLAGAETRIFVSTPLWVKIGIGSEQGTLQELPTVPLNDTWFGPNTRVGQLCFASRTAARVRMEPALRSPVRAITVVSVRNRTSAHMQVQRLKIPVPYLSLYVHNRDAFFTEEVHVDYMAEGQTDGVKVKTLPEEARDAVLVHGPRQVSERNAVLAAVGGLLG